MEKLDTKSIPVWFTYSQKDKLIRLSVSLNCSPAAIIRLGLKEVLEKGEEYIQTAIDAEDLAINEAIKAAKEARI